jgi:hypothetical protein
VASAPPDDKYKHTHTHTQHAKTFTMADSSPHIGSSHTQTPQTNERARFFAPAMSRLSVNLGPNKTQDRWNEVLRASLGAEAPLLKCP